MQKILSLLIGMLKRLGLAVVMGISLLPTGFSGLASRVADIFLTFFSMIVVVFKRLRHNLGISVSAVVGIVAVLSIVVCVPVFSYAVSNEVLVTQLQEKANSTNRRLFSIHIYYLDNGSATPVNQSQVDTITSYIRTAFPEIMGIDVTHITTETLSGGMSWKPVQMQVEVNSDEAWMNMGIFAMAEIPENAILVEGQWPDPVAAASDGPVPVAILDKAADDNFLNIGDRFRAGDVEVEIAAIWSPADPFSQFWFNAPETAYLNKMWVSPEVYQARLTTNQERPVFYASWYVIVNEDNLDFARAPFYARGLTRLTSELGRLLPGTEIDYSPLDALKAYEQRASSLTTLFYAVGSPMVILALLFISLTAAIAVQQYVQETATMRGRGTSWLQVMALNLSESVLLILIAVPLSLLGGWLAAVVMGKTLSFLRFTNRALIPFTFEGLNLVWLAVSAALIIVARFTPMLSISRTTIIRVKQEQSRASTKPLWQRLYLDFFLLVPGVYAYFSMSGLARSVRFLQRSPITQMVEQYRDVLLYVAPALMAMALCMISLRILPLLLRLMAWIVDRLPGAWAYLSMQQIARRPQDHASALLLIMISLSLSIYSASTAKTLDRWLYDSEYYKAGTDLAVHEYVLESTSSGGSPSGPPTGGGQTTVSELDLNIGGFISLEEHLKLPNVMAVTRVGKYPATFSYGVGESPCILMGIDRLEFPGVAFFREDFSSQSLGVLMNALAMEPNAVLVPQALNDEVGFRIGDRIMAAISVFDTTFERELVIVGTYNYFPTIYPDQTPTLVMNLDSIFENPDDVIGYDFWLKLRANTKTDAMIYQIRQMIDPEKALVETRGNAVDEIRKNLDKPERVGLFGILNVGFIATGVMPAIGFVLYSYASLKRRFIQLGILQAIGLSVRQLVGYLVLEQFLLMGLAIVFGVAVGLSVSYLFVPFLQVSATPGAPIPPFWVLVGWVESGWLSLAFIGVLVGTVAGTIFSLVRLKVFQAVKMGESM